MKSSVKRKQSARGKNDYAKSKEISRFVCPLQPDGRRKKRGCCSVRTLIGSNSTQEQNIVFLGTVEKYPIQPDFTKETGTSQRQLRYTGIGKFHRWHVGTQHVQTSRNCNLKNKVNNNINTFFVFVSAWRADVLRKLVKRATPSLVYSFMVSVGVDRMESSTLTVKE